MSEFLKNRIRENRGNQGMTLVEVLVALVLLVVVLTPAVNALTTTNRIWIHNEAINPSITQANISTTLISREIRGASQPSGTVDSVLVEDAGQRLIIYHYNGNSSEWEKIIYQVSTNKLNRIILSDTDPAAVISAAIPDASDSGWTTLLEGVTSNSVFNRPVNSRTVEVKLQVSDSGQTNPRFAPYNLASAYMIRSREVGAITGNPVPDETEPPVVFVNKVVLNPDSTKLIITGSNDQRNKTIQATIWPANATDKSVTWTSSNTEWVTVEYDSNDSLQANIKLIKSEDDWHWLVFPSVIPPNVTVTATPNDGGSSATCLVDITKWL